MPSNPLILCHPPLLLPSLFPSIRVFSNESVLHIRWANYWSFSLLLAWFVLNIYQGLCVQSCPTVSDPVDCSPPDSSVHGIFQARILEWVVISFSRGSSQSRDLTPVSIEHWTAGGLFVPFYLSTSSLSFSVGKTRPLTLHTGCQEGGHCPFHHHTSGRPWIPTPRLPPYLNLFQGKLYLIHHVSPAITSGLIA